MSVSQPPFSLLTKVDAAEALAGLAGFDTVIDVRSESEYAEDHLPGAVNWPVLDDAERHSVGLEYAEVSPFAATKRGAALAFRNIARHIDREVLDKPREWRPLVYCWRGGKRSGAFANALAQIGFRVQVVDGGYQRYRRAVIAALDELPARLDYRVICGSTGVGKSRLLHALAAQGAQVLDLEALANHRGSVLGLVPGTTQPGQKQFESRVWDALRRFDPARPVFVESESKKIGNLRVPLVLMDAMRAAPCLRLDLDLDGRVRLLLEDYDHFVTDTAAFCARLDALRAHRGHEVVNAWQDAARAGRTADVFRDLLVTHYDPAYAASMKRNFGGVSSPRAELVWDGSAGSLAEAAAKAMTVAVR